VIFVQLDINGSLAHLNQVPVLIEYVFIVVEDLLVLVALVDEVEKEGKRFLEGY
jgi:hypothetical protein